MLAAAQRLRRREDFAATVRGGRRASRGSLVVHLLVPATSPVPEDVDRSDHSEPASAEHSARAGFVVSRAVGGAVVRNLVKRRLRHLVRTRIGDLPPDSLLVVRALPEAARRTYQQMGLDLDAALTAARRPKAPRTSDGRR